MIRRMGVFCGVFAWLSVSALLAIACAQTEPRQEAPTVVVGTIQIVGNEPFTRVALEAASGRKYFLKCEREVETLLRNNQGRQARIHFRGGGEPQPGGTSVTVLRAELVTE